MVNSKPGSNDNKIIWNQDNLKRLRDLDTSGYDKVSKAILVWKTKVINQINHNRKVIPLTSTEIDNLDVCGSFNPPEFRFFSDFGLISLSYGENAKALEDVGILMKLKFDIIDRFGTDEACVFYGQLERLENVIMRLAFGLEPLHTPYWDKLVSTYNKLSKEIALRV